MFRLAHLCSNQQNDGVREGQPCVGFNAEQLEECDLEGKDNFLQRIDFLKQTTTHLARLGSNNHMLFTYKRKRGQAVCLRHDHDACVWIIDTVDDDNHWDVRHAYSFPGFGYVEASKTNKKFCVSPSGKILKTFQHIFFVKKRIINYQEKNAHVIILVCRRFVHSYSGTYEAHISL